MSLIFLLFQFTFRDAPIFPPSKVATEIPPKRNIMMSFKELGNNRNLQVICVCFSFIVGPFYAFAGLMSLIMSPFGFTVEQLATVGVFTASFGVLFSIIFARFLDRTRLYKISLIVLSLLPVFVMIALNKSLKTERFLPVLFTLIVFESIVLSAIPLCMSFSTEVTYPLQPSMANGMIQFFSQILTSLLSLLAVKYISVDLSYGAPTSDQIL